MSDLNNDPIKNENGIGKYLAQLRKKTCNRKMCFKN